LTSGVSSVTVTTTGTVATGTSGSYTYWDYTTSGTFAIA
jgi:hypothetical protein